MNQKDVLNLDNLESIVRKVVNKEEKITLSDFNLESYTISDNYKKKLINLEKGDYSEIRDNIEPIAKEAENQGYPPSIFTALYEAVLNAFQHGNKKNVKKQIEIAYKTGSKKFDILVRDEGGELDSNFIPFILRHREGAFKEKFIDFYEFSGIEKPITNNGTGTSFMHTYVDEVQYLKSTQNGLIVRMIKNKNNKGKTYK
ncbi:hypothetical protein CMO90_03705 [Candidatus Woesearchaeota archaeon]|jgi:anti-sigma regulatory factor (Ser/Thr protein kinase)|nr:hypothetical protein [Candidatus Woesearchaeota archaeon]|tara:strand:+ start:169 stop:768 length:600 start_codon:yes stop_codon:yes gene_type:complete